MKLIIADTTELKSVLKVFNLLDHRTHICFKEERLYFFSRSVNVSMIAEYSIPIIEKENDSNEYYHINLYVLNQIVQNSNKEEQLELSFDLEKSVMIVTLRNIETKRERVFPTPLYVDTTPFEKTPIENLCYPNVEVCRFEIKSKDILEMLMDLGIVFGKKLKDDDTHTVNFSLTDGFLNYNSNSPEISIGTNSSIPMEIITELLTHSTSLEYKELLKIKSLFEINDKIIMDYSEEVAGGRVVFDIENYGKITVIIAALMDEDDENEE